MASMPVIEDRVFVTAKGNKIEIIETVNLGRCGHTDHVDYWEGMCVYCLLNTEHTIKVNDIMDREPKSHMQIYNLWKDSKPYVPGVKVINNKPKYRKRGDK